MPPRKPPAPPEDYSRAQIQVLTSDDAIRKRSAMYVGEVNEPRTLTGLVVESLCLARAQACAGLCSWMTVTLGPQNLVRVEDDGRAAPIEAAQHGVSMMENILTQLYACRDMKDGHHHFCKFGIVCVRRPDAIPNDCVQKQSGRLQCSGAAHLFSV